MFRGACHAKKCVREPRACSYVDWQTGGDSLVDTIFDGLQEQSRLNTTNAPRSFHRGGHTRGGDLETEVCEAQVQQGDLPARSRPGRGGRVVARRRSRYVTLRHQHRQRGGQQVGTATCGRRLASSLPSHLQGRPGVGMGELQPRVRGDEQGSERPSPKWEQQRQDFLEGLRCQGRKRRVLRPGQRAEDCESRSGSAVWNKHQQERAGVEWTPLLSPFGYAGM